MKSIYSSPFLVSVICSIYKLDIIVCLAVIVVAAVIAYIIICVAAALIVFDGFVLVCIIMLIQHSGTFLRYAHSHHKL